MLTAFVIDRRRQQAGIDHLSHCGHRVFDGSAEAVVDSYFPTPSRTDVVNRATVDGLRCHLLQTHSLRGQLQIIMNPSAPGAILVLNGIWCTGVIELHN